MIVTWQQLGNFGNCMFEYTAARLFAEKFNYELKTDINFNGKDTNCEEFFTEFFDLEDKHNLPIESFVGIYDDELDKILNYTEEEFKNSKYFNKNVRMEGYFQDPSIFIDKEVNKFFKFDESKLIPVNDEDLCVSLRIGSDYKSLNFCIDPEIITNLLDSLWYNRLVIVADEQDSEYLKHFDSYNATIVTNDSKKPIKDFYTLMSFKNLIIPNSTFSYWAAVLGKANTIYAPKDWKFSKLNDIVTKVDKTILYSI
jgi:hypothetical protein